MKNYQKLKELCEIRKGKKVHIIENKTNKSTPYLLIDTLRGIDPEFFTEDEIFTEANPEDILIVGDGANSGLVGTNLTGAVGSTIIRIRTNPKQVKKDYLMYFLKANFQMMNKNIQGAAIPHLKAKEMLEMSILLPSIPEQQLIVDEIEKQFTRLDASINTFKDVKKKLEVYRKSILNKSFDSSNNFEYVKLSDVCKIVSGFAFKSTEFKNVKGITVVKITNVGYNIYVDEEKDFLPKDYMDKYEKFIVKPDNILLALTRPITNNKLKVCIYPKGKPFALLNQRVASIIPQAGISNKFLLYYFQSNWFKKEMKKGMTETLQPNLSPKKAENFKAPLCSEKNQKQIIQEIESSFSVIDKLEETVNNSLKKAEQLRKSILKSAFEGKLVKSL